MYTLSVIEQVSENSHQRKNNSVVFLHNYKGLEYMLATHYRLQIRLFFLRTWYILRP